MKWWCWIFGHDVYANIDYITCTTTVTSGAKWNARASANCGRCGAELAATVWVDR